MTTRINKDVPTAAFNGSTAPFRVRREPATPFRSLLNPTVLTVQDAAVAPPRSAERARTQARGGLADTLAWQSREAMFYAQLHQELREDERARTDLTEAEQTHHHTSAEGRSNPR